MRASATLLFLLIVSVVGAQDPRGTSSLIATASSTADVRAASEAILNGTSPADTSAADAARVARILLMTRDYARAEALFESAYLESGGTDLESLYYQAIALVELGDETQARRRAELVLEQTTDYELKRRSYTLIARTLHLLDRSGDALPMLRTLAELGEPDLVEPETLLLLAEVEAALETDEKLGEDLLGRLHAGSIASLTQTDDRFGRAPLPSFLARPGAVQLLPEPAPSSPQAVTSVQVGSFSDPENAEHLARDLADIGIPAAVTTTERDGRELSLVTVDVPGDDPAAAAGLLAALQDAGYDGFLIY